MKRRLCLIVFMTLSALLALGGCFATALQSPAPLTHYGGSEGAGATGMHTVGSGENLYAIATRYRLSLQDIVAENRLRPPFRLKAGQRIKLPPPREYRVREGDSLYEIARLFDAGESEIARLNALRPPYAVRSGQVLRLPSAAPPPADPVPLRRPTLWRKPLEKPGVADRSQTDALSSAQATAQGGEDDARFSGVLARLLGTRAPPPVPGAKPQVETPSSGSVAAASVKIPPPPPRGSGKFLWPVRGNVISGYGPKKGGLHNDGINIQARRGTGVKAAENGVVVYAGSGLQGYGNLVLVRHEKRWMTAYAHMEKIQVRKGQTVSRGDTVGAVGSTGSVDESQLHFEVRRGSDALNPLAFLE